MWIEVDGGSFRAQPRKQVVYSITPPPHKQDIIDIWTRQGDNKMSESVLTQLDPVFNRCRVASDVGVVSGCRKVESD